MRRKRVVLLGSGGHAKVIIDVLRSDNIYDVIGCLDASSVKKDVCGVKILGDDKVLPRLYDEGIRYAFIAIGDNARRAEIMRSITKMGFDLVNIISPFAHISPSVHLGCGIAVMPGAMINVDSVIEDNVIINTGATVDHDCLIGAHSHIGPGCHLAGTVSIGQGSFLGVGCSVIPQISIGEWTVVGASSAVINDLPGYSKAIGVPAKIQENWKND